MEEDLSKDRRIADLEAQVKTLQAQLTEYDDKAENVMAPSEIFLIPHEQIMLDEGQHAPAIKYGIHDAVDEVQQAERPVMELWGRVAKARGVQAPLLDALLDGR